MARATRGESTKSVSRAVRRHTNAGKRKLSSFQRERSERVRVRERSVPGRSLGKGRRNLGGDAAGSRGSSYCVRVSRNWRGHSALVLSLSFSHPCSWSSLSLPLFHSHSHPTKCESSHSCASRSKKSTSETTSCAKQNIWSLRKRAIHSFWMQTILQISRLLNLSFFFIS